MKTDNDSCYMQYTMPQKLRWANFRLKETQLSVHFWQQKYMLFASECGENATRDYIQQLQIVHNMLRNSMDELDYWQNQQRELQMVV